MPRSSHPTTSKLPQTGRSQELQTERPCQVQPQLIQLDPTRRESSGLQGIERSIK